MVENNRNNEFELSGFNAREFQSRIINLGLEASNRYEEEKNQLLPVAAKKLEDVIKPWWKNIKKAGTLNDPHLFDQEIFLSEPLLYPEKPETTDENIGRVIEELINIGALDSAKNVFESAIWRFTNDNLYQALFSASTGQNGNLIVRREIRGGLTFATATSVHRDKYSNRFAVSEESFDTLLFEVHPETLIVLGNEINEGKVDRKVKNYPYPIFRYGSSARGNVKIKLNNGEARLQESPVEEYRRTKAERYKNYLSEL